MRFAATNRSDSMFLLLPPQFADIRALQDLHHGAQHLQSLSMAEPRGATGFADEPINASDYIMSGIAGVCALACIVAFMAGRRTSADRHRPRTNTANVGVGNYEKSLENSASATKEYTRGAAGNNNYRGISADIIDNAITGTVDYTGEQSRRS